MLRSELLAIISNGESSGVEFKRDDSTAKRSKDSNIRLKNGQYVQ